MAGVLGMKLVHVVGPSKSADGQGSAEPGAGERGRYRGGSDYGMTAGQLAQFVSQLKNTAYGRDDELESDKLGVRFMKRAEYPPERTHPRLWKSGRRPEVVQSLSGSF